jgi:hypothetical protein
VDCGPWRPTLLKSRSTLTLRLTLRLGTIALATGSALGWPTKTTLTRWTAFGSASTLGRATESSGSIPAGSAHRTSLRTAPRAFPWATHHLSRALEGLPHLVLADFPVTVLIRTLETSLCLGLGEIHELIAVNGPIAALVHPAKHFRGIKPARPACLGAWAAIAGAFRAWAAIAGAFRARAAIAGAFRARAAIAGAFRAAATIEARSTHAVAHLFGHLAHLCFVNLAIAIAVNFGESLRAFLSACSLKLLLADLAVAIGIGALEVLSQSGNLRLAALWLALALLGLQGETAQGHKTKGMNKEQMRFHGVR